MDIESQVNPYGNYWSRSADDRQILWFQIQTVVHVGNFPMNWDSETYAACVDNLEILQYNRLRQDGNYVLSMQNLAEELKRRLEQQVRGRSIEDRDQAKRQRAMSLLWWFSREKFKVIMASMRKTGRYGNEYFVAEGPVHNEISGPQANELKARLLAEKNGEKPDEELEEENDEEEIEFSASTTAR